MAHIHSDITITQADEITVGDSLTCKGGPAIQLGREITISMTAEREAVLRHLLNARAALSNIHHLPAREAR